MQAKRVSETHLHMAQLMTPNDANFLGKVFGGSILSLIDLTASACSSRFAGRVCVTAAFDRVDFLAPVDIGQLVELEANITYVGRTSMEVAVQVHATHLPTGERRHVNSARVTMVAIEDGKPVPVPGLICETIDDKRKFLEGRLRREIRTERIAEMVDFSSRIQSFDEATLDRLINTDGQVRDAIAKV